MNIESEDIATLLLSFFVGMMFGVGLVWIIFAWMPV